MKPSPEQASLPHSKRAKRIAIGIILSGLSLGIADHLRKKALVLPSVAVDHQRVVSSRAQYSRRASRSARTYDSFSQLSGDASALEQRDSGNQRQQTERIFEQMSQTAANERVVAAESVTEEWQTLVSQMAASPGSRVLRVNSIQRSFLREFGPTLGPTDTNYESYCASIQNQSGRPAYPFNAIAPVWTHLYENQIRAWLNSRNPTLREQAFVLTLGLESHVSFTVPNRGDIPSALDIAMGRNDSMFYRDRTASAVAPRYDLVIEVLNTKIASHQEMSLCFLAPGTTPHPLRAQHDIQAALHDICSYYPEALRELPFDWWTPTRKAAATYVLQRLVDVPMPWLPVPNDSHQIALVYVQALNVH
ncbi:MAG: hypothetical protein HY817_04115 [Candidatus Abawacabacteria bacterium]|nr:hypothetical protein [Candidatus Abawacabacteria bacterium]